MKKVNKKLIVIVVLIVSIIFMGSGVIIINYNNSRDEKCYWKLVSVKNYDGLEQHFKEEEMSSEYLQLNGSKIVKKITDLNNVIAIENNNYYINKDKIYYSPNKINKNKLKGLMYNKIIKGKNKLTIINKLDNRGTIEKHYQKISKEEFPKE